MIIIYLNETAIVQHQIFCNKHYEINQSATGIQLSLFSYIRLNFNVLIDK